MSNIIKFVEGDTLPEIQGVWKDSDGNVVDITGYTITLHINYATPLEKTATITSAVDGEFTFSWISTDLLEGTWTAEVQVMDASGKILTAQRTSADKKLTFKIRAEIA